MLGIETILLHKTVANSMAFWQFADLLTAFEVKPITSFLQRLSNISKNFKEINNKGEEWTTKVKREKRYCARLECRCTTEIQ